MTYDLNPDTDSAVIKGAFDTDVNNAFVLVVFEDDHLRKRRQYTAVSDEVIISPKSSGKHQ